MDIHITYLCPATLLGIANYNEALYNMYSIYTMHKSQDVGYRFTDLLLIDILLFVCGGKLLLFSQSQLNQ